MAKIPFKTGYNDDKTDDPVIDCAAAEAAGDLSQTVQSEKDACDINRIIERFQKTGVITHTMDTVKAQFGDFSQLPDFQTAQNLIIKSNALFMELPAKIRSRFNNNAIDFMNFCADPANTDEAIKLGIAKAKQMTAEEQALVSAPKVAAPLSPAPTALQTPPAGT